MTIEKAPSKQDTIGQVAAAMAASKPPKTERKKREAREVPASVDNVMLENYSADKLFETLKEKRQALANQKNLPLEIAALKKEIDRRKGA